MLGNLKKMAGDAISNALLKEGDSGDAVKVLQDLLAKAGVDPGAVDGIFGKQTTDALKMIQEKLGVDADGVYGPATAAALTKLVGSLKK